MIELLTTKYAEFMAFLNANPAVAAVFSLWGLAAITFLLIRVPRIVSHFFFTQATTSLTFNNSFAGANELQYHAFMAWFGQTPYVHWSRHLALSTKHTHEGIEAATGPGFGTHFFFYQGRPFWFTISRLESSGSNLEKQEVTIYTLGRSQLPFRALINEFRYKPDNGQIGVYGAMGSDWSLLTHIPERPMETVIIPNEAKQTLMDSLDHFIHNRDWYRNRGMPYKKNIVLYGPPGTGKTSLVKALASYYERDVFQLNLSTLSDDTLTNLISRVKPGGFLLIEDFDSSSATQERQLDSGEVMRSEGESFKPLTLSGLLNALDGIVALDDVVVFMTTNHLDNIDPALLRKGRVDTTIHMGWLGDPEVREYIHLMYPEEPVPKHVYFEDIAGCDIQDLFLTHREDFKGFYQALAKVTFHHRAA